MKVSILIPVYNEAVTVRALLERVAAQPLPGLTKEIIVIDSNSVDGSRELVREFLVDAATAGVDARGIFQDRPRGKGHAVRAALASATGDIVIIQDADLEYDTADYPALLAPLLDGRSDLVLGSRHLGLSRWQIRNFGRTGLQAVIMNCGAHVFHGLFNLVFGTRLTDPTTMFKVFRLAHARQLNLTCNRFDFDFELLGKLVRLGCRPTEVPVRYRSRGFAEGKKIRVVGDPPSWVLAIVKSRFSALRSMPKDNRAVRSERQSVSKQLSPAREIYKDSPEARESS